MSFLLRLCLGLVLLAPSLAYAQSSLDVPSDGDKLSGIGVIHGWKCTAEGEITIVFNEGDPEADALPTAYGFPRDDTRATCRDDGTNGFHSVFNWAILGDGVHTAVAYDNGVAFARSTFTVTTTGEEFLTEAPLEYSGIHQFFGVFNFPSPGETTYIEWNTSTQHYEMCPGRCRSRSPQLVPPAHAQAALDVPRNGDTLSGIGIIHGWKCEAEGEITLVFNEGDPEADALPMAYGFPRDDTAAVCGNDGTNGFTSFFNWAILGDGTHTAVAYDNGVEFARSAFTVGTGGKEFLTFPPGAQPQILFQHSSPEGEPVEEPVTVFEWNASTQHFEMVFADIPAVPHPNPRARIDRPDDIRGPQVHVMYVLPRDGVDERLDTNGSITTSVAAIQFWLSRKIAQRFRLDTYRGSPDITFFRLARTDAQMAAQGAYLLNQIEDDLRRAGRLSPHKIYAIYYGGSSTYACGSAAWPPEIPGVTAGAFLYAEGCYVSRPTDLGITPASLGGWGFVMVHELFHVLGAVPRRAPHHAHAHEGHVSDDPRDLMYTGPHALGEVEFIDVGRDDYYGHNNPNLPDLRRSRYLQKSPLGAWDGTD